MGAAFLAALLLWQSMLLFRLSVGGAQRHFGLRVGLGLVFAAGCAWGAQHFWAATDVEAVGIGWVIGWITAHEPDGRGDRG